MREFLFYGLFSLLSKAGLAAENKEGWNIRPRQTRSEIATGLTRLVGRITGWVAEVASMNLKKEALQS